MLLKDYYEHICKKLDNKEEFLKTFSGLQNDEERFSIIYKLYLEHFPQTELKGSSKCNDSSENFRKEGNLLFKKKCYWKALSLYNKSIAYALLNSEALYTAYGNRAACLLRLDFPNEALQDVEKALSFCSSDSYRDKLLGKKDQCLSYVVQPDIVTTFGSGKIPLISREKSTFFESASNVVELSYNEHCERHLIANNDIEVGEILIVEKPYSSVVIPEHFYTHCSNCFRRSLNLIPCDNCVTTMFCSVECMSIAEHAVECSYLAILCSIDASRQELLSLKVLLDSSKQGKQLEELYTQIKHYNTYNSIVNVHATKVYKSFDFFNLYNLVTNSSRRTPTNLFYRTVVSVILVSILEKYTYFFDPVPQDKKQTLIIFAGGLILRFLQSLPCNAHEVSEYHSTNLTEIGAGAFATLSLINHSCDPNVVRYSCRNTNILRAIKPIKKGEQILDNYGYHYATHHINERQKALLDQYYFKCECEACLFDWPTFELLEEIPLTPLKPIDKILYDKMTKQFEEDLMNALDGDNNSAMIERSIAYLTYLHEFVKLPWINYNKCQELIKHCLNFQSNFFKPFNEV